MRVKNWNPNKYDGELIDASMKRLVKAAEVVKVNARARCPVGSISRPMYMSGKHAGQPWTARDAGALKRTIRVTEKYGAAETSIIGQNRNVRIYAGNYLVYYAKIVEYSGKKFMRTALNASRAKIREILLNG